MEQPDCLGYLYVLFPGETTWEKLYVMQSNCQLHFRTSIRNHSFKYSFVIYKIMMRQTRRYVVS